MNERIKELALKAGLSHMPSNYPDMADLYKGADFELEKFAELIVDEVYDYILNATFDDEPWPDRKVVKKHFGVEDDTN